MERPGVEPTVRERPGQRQAFSESRVLRHRVHPESRPTTGAVVFAHHFVDAIRSSLE